MAAVLAALAEYSVHAAAFVGKADLVAAAIANESQTQFGIAWVELSTGKFFAGQFENLDDDLIWQVA